MFRSRSRTENASRPSPTRGSVGSARVWDERTRALRAAGRPEVAPLEEPTALAPAELTALVAGLVAATLDTRLPECEPERRAALARELESRLLALLQGPAEDPADPSPPPERAIPSAPGEAVASRSPAALALGGRLEERLRALGGALAARADLRTRLVELALASVPLEANADAALPELDTLDLLQRRARKLERSLADARAALAYVAGLEHVEDGLASIYRTVQGLAGTDPQVARKREALIGIFRANLALQKPGETSPA